MSAICLIGVCVVGLFVCGIAREPYPEPGSVRDRLWCAVLWAFMFCFLGCALCMLIEASDTPYCACPVEKVEFTGARGREYVRFVKHHTGTCTFLRDGR